MTNLQTISGLLYQITEMSLYLVLCKLRKAIIRVYITNHFNGTNVYLLVNVYLFQVVPVPLSRFKRLMY